MSKKRTQIGIKAQQEHPMPRTISGLFKCPKCGKKHSKRCRVCKEGCHNISFHFPNKIKPTIKVAKEQIKRLQKLQRQEGWITKKNPNPHKIKNTFSAQIKALQFYIEDERKIERKKAAAGQAASASASASAASARRNRQPAAAGQAADRVTDFLAVNVAAKASSSGSAGAAASAHRLRRRGTMLLQRMLIYSAHANRNYPERRGDATGPQNYGGKEVGIAWRTNDLLTTNNWRIRYLGDGQWNVFNYLGYHWGTSTNGLHEYTLSSIPKRGEIINREHESGRLVGLALKKSQDRYEAAIKAGFFCVCDCPDWINHWSTDGACYHIRAIQKQHPTIGNRYPFPQFVNFTYRQGTVPPYDEYSPFSIDVQLLQENIHATRLYYDSRDEEGHITRRRHEFTVRQLQTELLYPENWRCYIIKDGQKLYFYEYGFRT